ncbi:MAG TPA: hypothetical protein VJ643_05215 [Nitrososphaera sp.]|nr:hypothetical protein [Nitrososphaera sp.]
MTINIIGRRRRRRKTAGSLVEGSSVEIVPLLLIDHHTKSALLSRTRMLKYAFSSYPSKR